MLDQNTDRMWYVIGAVIIGAALIFILNGTMPELFASVGDTFEDKTKETTEIVDTIDIPVMGDGVNLLEPLGLTRPAWHTVNVPRTAVNYIDRFVTFDEISIKAGDVLTVSFDYETTDFEFRSRVMFSPIAGETDDEFEINKWGNEWYSGKGRTSHTVTVPDGSTYLMLRLDNQRHNGDKVNVPVSVRHVKLERGSFSTPY